MPNRAERALFYFVDAFEAVSLAGGTMARVVDDGGSVVLLVTTEPDAASRATVARLSGAEPLAYADLGNADVSVEALRSFIEAEGITEMFTGPASDRTAAGLVSPVALTAAEAAGIPAYAASTGHAEPGAIRTVDIRQQADGKRDALDAFGTDAAAEWEFERFELASSSPATEAASGGWATRLATAALAFLIGAAFGAIGTVAHQATITVAGVAIPWALVLALIGVACLLIGLRMVIGDRLVVAACAAGIVLVVFLLSLRSVGGSVLIPQSTAGVVWTVAPAIIAALVLAWPAVRGPAVRGQSVRHA